MNKSTIHKNVIIGGGPAGYTAAIYASRAGLSPILYEGSQPGGQLTTTTDVENYPGYPTGVLGPQMMDDFRKQALRFGTRIITQIITEVDLKKKPFTLYTNHNSPPIYTESLVIATGAQPKWLGLPSEKKFSGRGVSTCAVCDGFFFKEEVVAVVGGGDSAAEEALYLARICKEVHIFVRKDRMRASQIMQARIKATPNIKVHWKTEVDEILGKDTVEEVRVKNKNTKEIIAVKGIFIAIGHQPNTQLFTSSLELDSQGYIITQANSSLTSVPGVFAAGDVQDHRYRQAITAAATGCMAALDTERYLNEK